MKPLALKGPNADIENSRVGSQRSALGYSMSHKMDSYIDGIAVGETVLKPKMDASAVTPISCPCCTQSVAVPSLEMVIFHYKITPLEARILGAIWKGKGMPVMAERIFDAMYYDDEDGGPSQSRMYAALKVLLSRLRGRLEGSGISIVNVGYRRGYRLVLGTN